MTKTISFNDLRQLKDSLPDGTMHLIADRLNITVQTVRNYFGGANYEFGKNLGIHMIWLLKFSHRLRKPRSKNS